MILFHLKLQTLAGIVSHLFDELRSVEEFATAIKDLLSLFDLKTHS